jgi:hypothetical protein
MPATTSSEAQLRAAFRSLPRDLQIEAIRQLLANRPFLTHAVDFSKPCHLRRILRQISPPA